MRSSILSSAIAGFLFLALPSIGSAAESCGLTDNPSGEFFAATSGDQVMGEWSDNIYTAIRYAKDLRDSGLCQSSDAQCGISTSYSGEYFKVTINGQAIGESLETFDSRLPWVDTAIKRIKKMREAGICR